MSLSKKLRFEVFKRDGFTCQYCGQHPPNITLECDHVDPKSNGGKDTVHNLIASCFDCNRGKSNHKLNMIPSSLTDHVASIKERENQYKAYRRLLDKIDNRIDSEIDEIQDIYRTSFPNQVFTATFRNASVKQFIAKLNIVKVRDAMSTAITKGKDSHNTIKYFCGICWTKIRNNG